MNIALCGFMGAGKTVVGKELAKITGRKFVDTDEMIEEKTGISIPAIFTARGEVLLALGEADRRRTKA